MTCELKQGDRGVISQGQAEEAGPRKTTGRGAPEVFKRQRGSRCSRRDLQYELRGGGGRLLTQDERGPDPTGVLSHKFQENTKSNSGC